MASLYKKRNKWHIDYSIKGKRYTRNTGLKDNAVNKSNALKIKREIEILVDEKKNESGNKGESLTLKGAYDLCLSNKFNSLMTSRSHKEQYKTALKRFMNVVSPGILIKDITKDNIKGFITSIINEVSNATMHTYIRYLKIFFNYLKDEELIYRSPIVKSIIPKRVKNEIVIFTNEELNNILKEAKKLDEDLYDILTMLSLTGIRPIDLLRLRYSDIDYQDKVIRLNISKTSKFIYFPLYTELESFMKNRFKTKSIKSDSLIFDGYSVETVGDKFTEIKEVLGIPNDYQYTLKTFRKTFATDLASKGLQKGDVSDLLGHENINTTTKYYVKANAEAMRKRLNEVITGNGNPIVNKK